MPLQAPRFTDRRQPYKPASHQAFNAGAMGPLIRQPRYYPLRAPDDTTVYGTFRIRSPDLGRPVFLDIHLVDLVLQQELIGVVAIHPAVEEEMIQISIHVIVFCHEGHNAKAL